MPDSAEAFDQVWERWLHEHRGSGEPEGYEAARHFWEAARKTKSSRRRILSAEEAKQRWKIYEGRAERWPSTQGKGVGERPPARLARDATQRMLRLAASPLVEEDPEAARVAAEEIMLRLLKQLQWPDIAAAWRFVLEESVG